MLHLINQTKLLFWKKMYTNSSGLLYTLSGYAAVLGRFIAVASQYGVHSLQLSSLLSGSLLQRQSISRMYFVSFSVLYFCSIFLCLYFMLLPSGVINKIL